MKPEEELHQALADLQAGRITQKEANAIVREARREREAALRLPGVADMKRAVWYPSKPLEHHPDRRLFFALCPCQPGLRGSLTGMLDGLGWREVGPSGPYRFWTMSAAPHRKRYPASGLVWLKWAPERVVLSNGRYAEVVSRSRRTPHDAAVKLPAVIDCKSCWEPVLVDWNDAAPLLACGRVPIGV
jgi:hypothetical protein